jgi:glycosyltransferase involved in cell wall biosynthesis
VLSYNHTMYVHDTLMSVVNISNVQEIIIIDDGSTDDSLIKIEEFAKQNCKVSFQIISKKNAGLVDSLNRALDICKTDYIYFIASDDLAIPKGVDQLFNKVVQLNQENIYIGGALNFWENGTESLTYSEKTIKYINSIGHLNDFQIEKKLFLEYPHPILIQSTIFNINVIKKVGRWNPGIISDDYQIFIKLFKELNKRDVTPVFFNDILTVRYRHHGTNSYKNLYRQYFAVNQIIKTLSKQALIRILAILKNTLYFSLKSLKFGQLKTFLKILFHFNK